MAWVPWALVSISLLLSSSSLKEASDLLTQRFNSGLPAAIGAKVAKPDHLVIDIDGDASFCMTQTELSTAAQFNIGVKIIILNNEEQGMVTQWQSIFYEDRFAHTHQKNPDFVKLSEAMGVQAQRCIAPGDVEAKLKWLIESDGPALLEIVTDKKVPVLPMVEAGSGLHEMRVYDASKLCLIFRRSIYWTC